MSVRGRLEVDFVRAEPKDFAQFAHLRHLRLTTPTLPEIDRLRLDTDGDRQLELRPSAFTPQRADRLHRSGLHIDITIL